MDGDYPVGIREHLQLDNRVSKMETREEAREEQMRSLRDMVFQVSRAQSDAAGQLGGLLHAMGEHTKRMDAQAQQLQMTAAKMDEAIAAVNKSRVPAWMTTKSIIAIALAGAIFIGLAGYGIRSAQRPDETVRSVMQVAPIIRGATQP